MKEQVSQLLEQKNNVEAIERASSRFDFKPYHLKYRGLKNLSKVSSYLLPIISIGTGAFWLGGVMQNIVPLLPLAIVLGALLVIGLEYLKNYALGVGLTDSYNGIRGGLLMVFLGILFAFGSGFISLKGIENLNNTLDKSVSNLQASHEVKKDSLVLYYDNQIKSTQNELKDFKASVSYQGKINIYNPTTAKKLESLDTRLNDLNTDKRKALATLTGSQTEQVNILNASNGFNLYTVLVIILIIELAILISNWYMVYYDYRIKKESHNLQDIAVEPTFTVNQFWQMWNGGHQALPQTSGQYLNSGTSNHSGMMPQNPIGFQTGVAPQNQETQRDFKENSPSIADKIKALEKDLKQGILDTRTLCKKHKVNVIQVSEAKKRLGIKSKKEYV